MRSTFSAKADTFFNSEYSLNPFFSKRVYFEGDVLMNPQSLLKEPLTVINSSVKGHFVCVQNTTKKFTFKDIYLSSTLIKYKKDNSESPLNETLQAMPVESLSTEETFISIRDLFISLAVLNIDSTSYCPRNNDIEMILSKVLNTSKPQLDEIVIEGKVITKGIESLMTLQLFGCDVISLNGSGIYFSDLSTSDQIFFLNRLLPVRFLNKKDT